MIKGAYGVLLTPFTSEGKVDYNAYEKELDFVLKSDVTGFFACGTTGEFVSLSPRENMEILEFTAKHLGGKKKLLAGVSDPNPQTTVKYMKHAANLGYDAAMVCPPYYFTMGQEDLIRYYEYIAAEDICDIVLYKIPMFTNNIELGTFEKLLNEKRIVGMKDSGQNIKQIAHEADLITKYRPDFSLLCGTDDSLVPSLLAGCVGSVTAFSVIVPEVNAKIYALFNQGKIAEAMELNRKALPLLRLADSLMFPSGYKLVYEERGLPVGHCQITDIEKIENIRPWVKEELAKLLSNV